MANTSLVKRRERQSHKRMPSAVGELDLTRNLAAQFAALVTLLTEILAMYRTDGCRRVRVYVRRLDEPQDEEST